MHLCLWALLFFSFWLLEQFFLTKPQIFSSLSFLPVSLAVTNARPLPFQPPGSYTVHYVTFCIKNQKYLTFAQQF